MNAADAKKEIRRFSATKGYPALPEGELELVNTLIKIARNDDEAHRIISNCIESSQFCPTAFDLRQVAAELHASQRLDTSIDPKICPKGLCDGHGWKRVFWLVTEEATLGGGNYKLREQITEEQYSSLARKVDGTTQQVYDSVRRCACKPQPTAPAAHASQDRRAAAAGDRT